MVNLQAPPEEIGIEIRPEELRKYNLSLSDVTLAIRRHSANYSAGQLKTESGVITVRSENQY